MPDCCCFFSANDCLFRTKSQKKKFARHQLCGHTVYTNIRWVLQHDDRLRLCTQHDKTFSKQIFVESDVWINWLASGSSYTAYARIYVHKMYIARNTDRVWLELVHILNVDGYTLINIKGFHVGSLLRIQFVVCGLLNHSWLIKGDFCWSIWFGA